MTAILPYYQNIYQGMDDYATQLKQMEQAQLAAQAQALKEAVTSYEAQKQKTAQQAVDARSDVYSNARLSAIGNNEILAGQGLAGNLYNAPASGYSETSRVKQDVGMRASLASIDKAKIEAVSEIDRAIASLQAQGKVQEAQIMAETAQKLYAYQEQLRQQQLLWAQQEYERALALESKNASDAMEKAKILASYGDFSGYAALGWDTSAMQTTYQAAQSAGSSSSSSGSSSKPTATQYKVAVAAALSGDRSSSVVSIIERYSGLPFSTALAAEKALAGGTSSSSSPKTTANQARTEAGDSLSTIASFLYSKATKSAK